jgi:RNA polymerase sigma-70 factor (ECF subfamily)
MSVDAKLKPDTSEIARERIPYAQLVLLSDEALMIELKAGAKDALSVLFDRYYYLVMKVAIRILRDAGEAEDLTQSVFLEIFRSASLFDPARGTTKVWLLQCAYHRGFNRRQYLNLRGICLGAGQRFPIKGDPATGYYRSLSGLESARAVNEALEHLNDEQRTAIELAHYEGLTMHEIAEFTGDSFHNVRHHYYRGLKKLKSVLSGLK